MALFNRIVVGTDGSESAAEAVRQAVELAGLTGARLDVVSAYEPVPNRRVESEVAQAPGDVAHEFGPREEATFALDSAVGAATAAGIGLSPGHFQFSDHGLISILSGPDTTWHRFCAYRFIPARTVKRSGCGCGGPPERPTDPIARLIDVLPRR